MASIILTHLGEDSPFYIRDCVHQIRLWNLACSTKIYVILEPCHRASEFWINLSLTYSLNLTFTDILQSTPLHDYFKNKFKGDINFRKGYWKHVKERFFYIEELMLRESLHHVISMEYDVMLYTNINTVVDKLKQSHQTLRIVRDNDQRGHPAFMYIPSAKEINHFNTFLVSIIQTPLEDMQSLAAYADTYKGAVHYLPVITHDRNYFIRDRSSKAGHTSKDPYFLSEDSDHFGFLFDSLVVGQWVGGIDSRNVGGNKIAKYENESALYNINEMNFAWKKDPNTFLWQPHLDNRLLIMIHVHSKSLVSFSSDRPDYPKDDYDVDSVYKKLLPN